MTKLHVYWSATTLKPPAWSCVGLPRGVKATRSPQSMDVGFLGKSWHQDICNRVFLRLFVSSDFIILFMSVFSHKCFCYASLSWQRRYFALFFKVTWCFWNQWAVLPATSSFCPFYCFVSAAQTVHEESYFISLKNKGVIERLLFFLLKLVGKLSIRLWCQINNHSLLSRMSTYTYTIDVRANWSASLHSV